MPYFRQLSFKRSVSLEFSLVVLFFFGVYILTMYPGPGGRIWFGDSVRWQLLANLRGLGHPTGYPLYLFLTKAFNGIFLFVPSWVRVNLVSVVFALVTLVGLQLLLMKLDVSRIVRLVFVFIFGLSYTFWSQATEAEVYTLQSGLTIWSILCMTIYYQSKNIRWFYIAFAIFSLAFANHLTTIFLAAPLAIIALSTDRTLLFNRKVYTYCALLLVGGASFYTYIWSLYFDPNLDFRFVGHGQVKTFYTFVDFVTGGYLKNSMHYTSLHALLEARLPYLSEHFAAQYHWSIYLLAIFALWILFRTRRAVAIALVVYLISYTTYCSTITFFDVFVYFIPTWMLVAALSAIGIESIRKPYLRYTVLSLILLAQATKVIHNLNEKDIIASNERLARINEYLSHVPERSKIIPGYLGNNSSIPTLYLYLNRSKDWGDYQLVQEFSGCVESLYFTDESKRRGTVPQDVKGVIVGTIKSNSPKENIYLAACS